MTSTRTLAALLTAAVSSAITTAQPVALRVATFNIEDLRTAELSGDTTDRVNRAVEIVQRIRPNVLLVNEITYDMRGDPGHRANLEPGLNGGRLADLLAEPAFEGIDPLEYRAVMLPVNTGVASGFDLDRNGITERTVPPQLSIGADGTPPPQTTSGRVYGNDAWGFGTYPGQHGMALLVDARLQVLEDQIRTFQLFPWKAMPGNLMPTVPDRSKVNPDPWYEGEAGDLFRLSSKSHWDVPIRMPNGEIVHFLCSHPTPPAFDGNEQRNVRRNHDEIRFWADYLENAAYIIDDDGNRGGLGPDDQFVIMGDLNADPDEGSSIPDTMALLFESPRVLQYEAPTSPIDIRDLAPDATAQFGLRVDYVLPSAGLHVLRAGVWRHGANEADFPSDHFPVWADIAVPATGTGAGAGAGAGG
ncbi:MAG: endonuclease/exonuclease/phosphatase family protein [Planctomycetota bacterium]